MAKTHARLRQTRDEEPNSQQLFAVSLHLADVLLRLHTCGVLALLATVDPAASRAWVPGLQRASGSGTWLAALDSSARLTAKLHPGEQESTLVRWLSQGRGRPDRDQFTSSCRAVFELSDLLVDEQRSVTQPSVIELFGRLVEIRNKTIGHGAYGQRFWADWAEQVSWAPEWIANATPLWTWDLLVPVVGREGRRSRRLRGDSGSGAVQTAEPLSTPHLYDRAERTLPLPPLLYIDTATNHTYIVNGNVRGGTAELLCHSIEASKANDGTERIELGLLGGAGPGSIGTVDAPTTFAEPRKEASNLLSAELESARQRGADIWWQKAASRWFGQYFAFWHKSRTTPTDQVVYDYAEERYDAERFGYSSELNFDNNKAVIVGGGSLLGDVAVKKLRMARTRWGFAHEWAKDHGDELLNSESEPSVFGISDRLAYPGLAGVHTVMQTADGYIVFALRASNLAFYPSTWSASFEESVAASTREFTGPDGGDQTVFDTIVGGLYEEWQIPSQMVLAHTVMAVGREFVRTAEGRLDLSSSILAAIKLAVPLNYLWERLDAVADVRDLEEHQAWAGVKFDSRDDVLALLAAGRDRTSGVDFLREVADDHPGVHVAWYKGAPRAGIKDRGLMPTSPARLYLGTQWLSWND